MRWWQSLEVAEGAIGVAIGVRDPERPFWGDGRDDRAEDEAIGVAIEVAGPGRPFWRIDRDRRAEYEAIGVAMSRGPGRTILED